MLKKKIRKSRLPVRVEKDFSFKCFLLLFFVANNGIDENEVSHLVAQLQNVALQRRVDALDGLVFLFHGLRKRMRSFLFLGH